MYILILTLFRDNFIKNCIVKNISKEEAVTYLTSINALTARDSNNYWIASRKDIFTSGWSFCVVQIGANVLNESNISEILYVTITGLSGSGNGWSSSSTGVRPIITNPVNYSFTNG